MIDINRIKLKNEINLFESCIIITLKDLCVYKVSTNMSNKSSAAFHKSKKFTSQSGTKLHETDEQTTGSSPNDLFKSTEYFVHQQMFNKRPFFSTNFSEFNLPSDTMFAHFFFSEFYFPDDCNYPTPCSQIFSHISPILINIDYLTLLWINTLALSLWNEKLSFDKRKNLEFITNQEKKSTEDTQHKQTRLNLHCDTHVELLMPKITISIYSDVIKKVNEHKRQNGIEIGFARITATNKTSILSDTNLISACSKVYDLSQKICHKNSKFSVFNSDNNEKKSQIVRLNHLAPCLNDLVKNENLAYFRYDLSFDDDLTKLINTTNEATNSKNGLFLKSLNRSALNKNANKDLWCINFESMWLDSFSSIDSNENNTTSANNIYTQYKSNNTNENIPLIQNISFKLWLVNVHDFYKPFENDSTQNNEMTVNKSENVNRAFDKLSKVIKIEDIKIQPNKKRSNSLSAAGFLNKNQQNSYYLSQKMYSKINVISEINELTFKCSHSQIIFLLRLVDTVDMFTKQLKEDSEHTLKFTKNNIDITDIKDKNNNTNGLNSEFDFSLSENNDNNETNDNLAATLNFSLIVNSIEVELHLNDLRKEINSDFIPTKNDLAEDESTPEKIAVVTTNQLVDLNETATSDNPFFDPSYLNITIKDPMKDDTLLIQNEIADITKKLDQEFISGYLRYIYGFSTDNPNLKLSFSTVLFDDPSNNNNNNDIANLAKQVNKIPTNINSVVSVGFTAASSTIISKKNSTISFFNKPSFSQIKSNLKNQLNPQSLNSLNDLNDNDALIDDNDSYSVIMSLDQDDATSLASFSTESSYQTNNNNSPKEKRSPTDPKHPNIVPNSSSSSSINTKITSISSQVIINDIKLQETSNNESKQQEPSLVNNPTIVKQFQEFECQTVQTTLPVKFKLNNLNTFVQVNDNSDMFALVNLNQIQIRNLKSKFKKSNHDFSLFDDESSEEDTSEILIRFKRIEESSDCKDGLLEILLEDFSFEMDMSTLTGLIEFIDDDDIGVLVKEETLPFNVNIKNCQFFLNDQINETNEYFKNAKTVNLTINNLFVSRLVNNEIKITELNKTNSLLKSSNFSINNKKRNRSLKEESLSLLDEIENDTNSIKPVQLASLVFQLRKSKEQNHNLQNDLELEKIKNKELESNNLVFKNENKVLLLRLKEMEASNSIPTNDKLELERKQFESIIKSYQDENEQLKNKLTKTDDLLAILNIERDCLIKKLSEQLKLTKK